jgi:hypothetical protein
MKRILPLFAICLIFGIANVVGCWIHPGSVSHQKRSFTGNFGRYQLDGADAVRDFNDQAKKLFLEHGFVVNDDKKFCDIVPPGNGDWDKPGELLLLKHNEQNLIYVFIPQCHHPEDSIQIIGFHGELEGTVEEVKKYGDDFDTLINEFKGKFPNMMKYPD